MTRSIKLATMALMGLLVFATGAWAIPANATVPFNFSGVSTDNNANIAAVTMVTFNTTSSASNNGTGSFAPTSCGPTVPGEAVCSGDSATNSAGLNLTMSDLGPFVIMFGIGNRYTYTVSSFAVVGASATGETINTFGTFMDSGSPQFDSPASASMTFGLTSQCTGGLCSASISGTFQTPSAAPEPATMSLLGSALLGLGFIARKKLVRR